MPCTLLCRGYLQVQKAVESRIRSRQKAVALSHLKCRENAVWAAFPRPGRLFWPRALARGLSWSVHVGVCFWKLHPGSLFQIFEIIQKSSYLDLKYPKSFINEFPSYLWLLSSSCKCLSSSTKPLGLDRILFFPSLQYLQFSHFVFAF